MNALRNDIPEHTNGMPQTGDNTSKDGLLTSLAGKFRGTVRNVALAGTLAAAGATGMAGCDTVEAVVTNEDNEIARNNNIRTYLGEIRDGIHDNDDPANPEKAVLQGQVANLLEELLNSSQGADLRAGENNPSVRAFEEFRQNHGLTVLVDRSGHEIVPSTDMINTIRGRFDWYTPAEAYAHAEMIYVIAMLGYTTPSSTTTSPATSILPPSY